MMPDTRLLLPQQRAQAIQEAWARFLVEERAKRGSPQKRPHIYASGWSPCDRRLVLDMVEGDKLPPLPVEALANMRRGEDRERDLISDLRRIGRNAEPRFEVIGEQERFELRDRQGRPVIVGKVDGQIQFEDGLRAPLETKSWSQNLTARIDTFADCFRSPWTKRGAYQMLSYLYGAGRELGFLMLDKHGLPALLPVELNAHLVEMEEFLTRAEAAQDHRQAGTLPDFTQDADECRRCSFFGGVCSPPITSGQGAAVLGEELEGMLSRWYELKDGASEFDELDGEIKKALRGTDLAVCGEFLIEGKWQQRTYCAPPDQVQKQIKELQAPWKQVEPKGSFRLRITKVGA